MYWLNWRNAKQLPAPLYEMPTPVVMLMFALDREFEAMRAEAAADDGDSTGGY